MTRLSVPKRHVACHPSDWELGFVLGLLNGEPPGRAGQRWPSAASEDCNAVRDAEYLLSLQGSAGRPQPAWIATSASSRIRSGAIAALAVRDQRGSQLQCSARARARGKQCRPPAASEDRNRGTRGEASQGARTSLVVRVQWGRDDGTAATPRRRNANVCSTRGGLCAPMVSD